ncbi:hypothetical protein [Nonomuraea salmonea]|uniref:hypothetical protein n=1 Tax=Nonomuraea salmonea TaxID=46181 RepID=UPI002FE7223E
MDRLRNPRRRHGLALWWRLRWRLYPGRGFARRLELHFHYGLPAARKVARRARPSLRGWWARHVVRRNEIALFLGWAQGWIIRFRTYATLEDHILCLAPHKEGKTAHLSGWVIDAPGAAVVTSIRDDVAELTAGLRRGEVHLFNPERFGSYASTVRWSPVRGCHDQSTAIRRAATMVAATETGGLTDQAFWTNQAAMTLAALLYAAGLEDLSLEHVDAWTLNEDPTPPEKFSPATVPATPPTAPQPSSAATTTSTYAPATPSTSPFARSCAAWTTPTWPTCSAHHREKA